MPRSSTCTLLAIAAALWLGAEGTARAGLDDCGDIHVEAMATCEILVECTAMCEPIAVRAACAGRLQVECDAGCDELPSVDCEGGCHADCQARCSDFEPGSFDCDADCRADCAGECSARCDASESAGNCEASCTASCDAHCEASCSVEPPRADCDASCEASCEGSCTSDANFDCEIDCHAEGSAECEGDVQGGCEIACESEEGALFCDGQYVDHGGNLERCVDAIEAALDLEVESHAEAECSNGYCEASASAKISSDGLCAAAPGRPGRPGGALLLGAGIFWGLAARRGRRRA